MITRNAQPRRRAGLSLVEAMIALVITATLLTAVSAAFISTSRAMEVNDDFFRATQSARVSLVRIVSQVRRGLVSEKNSSGVVYPDNTTLTSVRILTDQNKDITYTYDATAKQLIMVTNDVTTDSDYVLARNVADAKFVIGIGTDANNAKCVSEVSVSIVVTVGNNTVRLSGSATPRRTLKY